MLPLTGSTYKEEVPVNARATRAERSKTLLDSARTLKTGVQKTQNSRQNYKTKSEAKSILHKRTQQEAKNENTLSKETIQSAERKAPRIVAGPHDSSSPLESRPLTKHGTEKREKALQSETVQQLEKTAKKETTETKNSAQIDAYLYSAKNHELKNDNSQALSYYREILKIDKNNFLVMNNIAYILLRLGLISESIEYSQKAVTLKKDYVPGLINLAIAYAGSGDFSASEKYLVRALEIEPANKSVLFNLAILHEKKQDYDQSSEYFMKLGRLGDLEGSLGLARIYEKQNKIEEAKKIYKNLFSRDSLDNEIRQTVRQRLLLLNEQ